MRNTKQIVFILAIASFSMSLSTFASNQICQLNTWCELKRENQSVDIPIDAATAKYVDGFAGYACTLEVAGTYNKNKYVFVSLRGNQGFETDNIHMSANEGSATISTIIGKFKDNKNPILTIHRLAVESASSSINPSYIMCEVPPIF